ncbi:hypothetical protein ACLOJK_039412 [Asimina triloba]
MRAKRDETCDDAEGLLWLRRILKATTEVADLHLQKLNVETSIQRLSDQVAYAREGASKLSLELSTAKAKATILRDQVGSLSSKLKSSELGSNLDERFRVVSQPDRLLAFLRCSKGGISGVRIDPSAYGQRASGSLLVSLSSAFFFPWD